jgi:hypothetical protein
MEREDPIIVGHHWHHVAGMDIIHVRFSNRFR